MQFCTKLTVICRSNIGLLSFLHCFMIVVVFMTKFQSNLRFLLINVNHELGDNRLGTSHSLTKFSGFDYLQLIIIN